MESFSPALMLRRYFGGQPGTKTRSKPSSCISVSFCFLTATAADNYICHITMTFAGVPSAARFPSAITAAVGT